MGKLIYLMGASGSGKDCLLNALRAEMPDNLLVAHRYITRPADAGAENHLSLTQQEFTRRHARGLFALAWHAHQLCYGVGIEIDLWLQQDFDVVVNGSRAHLPQARLRYGQQLQPICLQVSAEILRHRLRQRGRENEQQIALRLARAAEYTMTEQCQWISNDGDIQQTLRTFWQTIDAG